MMIQGRSLLASPAGQAILLDAKARGYVRTHATMGDVTDEEACAVRGMMSGTRIHIHTDTYT